MHFIKEYPFSTLCVVLIWVLSLAPYFPETPLDNVAFIDKYTHFIMYGGTCAVIWWEQLRLHRRSPWLAMAAMTALGGLMELLQAYCTTTRSGEWLDFWADSVGVLLGTAVGLLIRRFSRRWIR